MKSRINVIRLLLAVVLTICTTVWAASPLTQKITDTINKDPWVDVRVFGAKGDGIANDSSAVQAAINTVGRTRVLYFPAGVYLLNNTINITTPGVHLMGATPGFVYGPSGSATIFKFTGGIVGINTYVNPKDPLNVPYITIENITVDGNRVLTTGFAGGFFSNLINSTFINCLGSGAVLKSAQASTISKCGFNGNRDGLEIQGGGTVYPTECVFRQNTRYGVNISGVGGVIPFEKDIFESNGGPGLNLGGDMTQVTFKNGCYFEQNDSAQGASGYHVKINNRGNFGSEGIVFDGAYFASTGLTKVANIAAGKVQFNNCTHVGDPHASPVEKADGAEVIAYKSFVNYPLLPGVKIIPEVTVDQATALFFSGNGFLDIRSRAIAFRNSSFSVGITLEPNEGNHPVRPVLDANPQGFKMVMMGSSAGMEKIAFYRAGQESFHQSVLALRNNTPSNIVYVRQAGAGYLYVNGVLADSFQDTNDYTGVQYMIGNDLLKTGMNAKLYNCNFFNIGLTAAQVLELWRNGGNARAARLNGLTLNLVFDSRPAGKIYNSVAPGWINFTGSVSWLNPSSPAN